MQPGVEGQPGVHPGVEGQPGVLPAGPGHQPGATHTRNYEPRPRNPSTNWRIIGGWSGVGLGSALVVVGAALGGLAGRARSNIVNAADGTPWSSVRDDYNAYKGLLTGAAVCAGLGVAIAGSGAFLLVWNRYLGKREAPTSVLLAPTPGGAAVTWQGRF